MHVPFPIQSGESENVLLARLFELDTAELVGRTGGLCIALLHLFYH